jgi:hypothetical protein
MKRLVLILLGSVLCIILLAAGAALAATQQGLLVDKNGDPVEGYSNVWIVDGVAQPVYNPTTHLWYSLFIVGTAKNGVVLCVLGPPLGTRGDYEGGFERHERIIFQTG